MSVSSMRIKEGQTPINSIVIVVEASSPEDFSSIAVRNQVLAFARSHGLPTASGLGGIPNSYPVDDKGEVDEDLILGKRPFKCFQAEYTVNAGI